MMILYVCEHCGRWQDASLGKVIVDSWNKAVGKSLQVPTLEQSGVPCPSGCGLMCLVNASDRLTIRPEEEENATTTAAETQETARPGLTLVRE